jgi:hypothetical protein
MSIAPDSRQDHKEGQRPGLNGRSTEESKRNLTRDKHIYRFLLEKREETGKIILNCTLHLAHLITYFITIIIILWYWELNSGP